MKSTISNTHQHKTLKIWNNRFGGECYADDGHYNDIFSIVSWLRQRLTIFKSTSVLDAAGIFDSTLADFLFL